MSTKNVIAWLQKDPVGCEAEAFTMLKLECAGDLAWARGSTTGQVARILRGILQARQISGRRIAEFLGLDPVVFEDLLNGLRDVSVQALTEIGAALGYRLQLKYVPNTAADEDPDFALLLRKGREISHHAGVLQACVREHCKKLERLSRAMLQEFPALAAALDECRTELEQAREMHELE
jgi:transcriptional regulator with XRE-family HTH domain